MMRRPEDIERERERRRRDMEDIDVTWLATLIGFCALILVGYLIATWESPPADLVSARVIAEQDAKVKAQQGHK